MTKKFCDCCGKQIDSNGERYELPVWKELHSDGWNYGNKVIIGTEIDKHVNMDVCDDCTRLIARYICSLKHQVVTRM